VRGSRFAKYHSRSAQDANPVAQDTRCASSPPSRSASERLPSRQARRRLISCHTTLLKFVHAVRGGNYTLHLVLRGNFARNPRVHRRKTLKSNSREPLIALYISVSLDIRETLSLLPSLHHVCFFLEETPIACIGTCKLESQFNPFAASGSSGLHVSFVDRSIRRIARDVPLSSSRRLRWASKRNNDSSDTKAANGNRH